MIPILSAVLIAANALLVLMEFALMRSRPARIEVLARKGSPRAVAVQEVMTRFDEHLAAIQLCLTVIALALGALAEPAVTHMLEAHFARWLDVLPEAWARTLSFLVAVGAIAEVQIVLAELMPRAVALHYAEPIALIGARPLKMVAAVLRWPVRLTTALSKGLLKAVGVKSAAEAEHTVTVDEMRILLGETQEKGALPLERLLLLENLFDFGAAKVADAMRPREKLACLSLKRPWAENLALIRRKRYSRYPLCETDDPDTAIGYVHVKDVLLRTQGPEPDLKRLRRDLFEVSDSVPLEKLVKTMPDKGIHMALVRDGLNRVVGVLTLEDIVEELIGEVRDEFSRPRAWADGELFTRAAVDANLVPGDRRAAIKRLLDKLKLSRPELDADAAFNAVWERELKFASAVGRGVLVPHARLPGLTEPMIAVGRYAKGAAFPTPDGVPVRLVFLILTPAETPEIQLKILQRIASLVTNENLRRRLWRSKTDEAFLETLRTGDTVLAF
jgi:CBS domain containing-hemolysin-like protein/mannitol/fructose-specific phosphotransferase system IIA component (Ntr-type)